MSSPFPETPNTTNLSADNDSDYDLFHSVGPYWPGWITYSILLAPTLLCNVVTMVVILTAPILRRNPNAIMVLCLAIEDAFLSLFCLIQCLLNLQHHEIYLGWTGCELQAIYAIFFVMCSGYTLCCIAYHNDGRVHGKSGLSIPKIIRIHVLIWLWSALMTWLSADGIHTRARVMPSGTYCFVSLQEIQSGLFFYIPGVLCIGSFIVYRYLKMYFYIRRWSWKNNQNGDESKNHSGNNQVHPQNENNHHHNDLVRASPKPKPSPHLHLSLPSYDGNPSPLQLSNRPSVSQDIELKSKKQSDIEQDDEGDSDGSLGHSDHQQHHHHSSLEDNTESQNHAHNHNHQQQQQQQHGRRRRQQQQSATSLSQTRVSAATKTLAFILCYFLCALPVLILSLYELFSGSDAPGTAHLIAGHFVHLNSLLNPLLYFWTNKHAVRVLKTFVRQRLGLVEE